MQLSHSTQESGIWVTVLSYLTTWCNGLWAVQPVTKKQGERSLDAQNPQQQDCSFSLWKGHLKAKVLKEENACQEGTTQAPLTLSITHCHLFSPMTLYSTKTSISSKSCETTEEFFISLCGLLLFPVLPHHTNLLCPLSALPSICGNKFHSKMLSCS